MSLRMFGSIHVIVILTGPPYGFSLACLTAQAALSWLTRFMAAPWYLLLRHALVYSLRPESLPGISNSCLMP